MGYAVVRSTEEVAVVRVEPALLVGASARLLYRVRAEIGPADAMATYDPTTREALVHVQVHSP